MSLTTYAGMQAAIADWLSRSDLSISIPYFISLAEIRFNRDLRLNAQDSTNSGTLSGGSIAIPDDLVDLKRITITRNGESHDLRYVSPEDFDNYSPKTGYPFVYTSFTNNYQVAPGPDSNYPFTLFYSARFPALATAGTNWLLVNAPDVYLYASLLEAAPFLRDDGRIMMWQQAYQSSVAKLREQDENMRYPNANLAIRADRFA